MAGTGAARQHTLITRDPDVPGSVEVGAAMKTLEGRWKLVIILHLFRQPVSRLSDRSVAGVRTANSIVADRYEETGLVG